MSVCFYKLELIRKNQYLTWDNENNMYNGFTRFLKENSKNSLNNSYQNMFNKFNDFIKPYEFLEPDYERTFKVLGKTYDDYFLIDEDYAVKKGKTSLEILLIYQHKEDPLDVFKIYESDIKYKTIKDSILVFEDIEFFKIKKCENEFFEKTLIDTFIDNKLHKDATLIIPSNEEFENFKRMIKTNVPNWNLNQNEIIYISW